MGSLTERQKSILIGMLLGDGSLRKKRNTLVEVNHSISQKDYVLWLYSELRDLVATSPVSRISGKNRLAIRFTTRSLRCLNEFYTQFYPGGCKSIPIDLQLDPLSISVWYMDDGSLCGESDVYLNTQQFSLKDQNILIECLKRYRVKARVNRDKTYFRLRIIKDYIPNFVSLIIDNIHPSMLYKIPQ